MLGGYIARVFEGTNGVARRFLGSLERRIYRLCRIDPARETTWVAYLTAVLTLSVISTGALFVLLCTQAMLPLNPQHVASLAPLVAFNIAVSFIPGVSDPGNGGPRALSEILYAFTSVGANNGSALGGLTIQTDA